MSVFRIPEGARRGGALLLLATVTSVASASDRKFLSGYAGTIPPRDSDRARTYFEKPAVRALLGRLESGSVPSVEVDALLKGSGASVEDLQRVGLLRRDEDRFAIGFAYFTAEDMKAIYAVADRAAADLAAAYRGRKREFDRILRGYPATGVPRDELAFVLLAGFSLNWDGLALTREMGLRRPRLVEGKDFRYSFWASEDVPGRDYREFYWGSSTYPLEGAGVAAPRAFSFSSFGDPESDPRMNFPDLAFLSAGELAPSVRSAAERVGLRDTEEMGEKFHGVLGGNVLRAAADVLFALRKSPLPAGTIAGITGNDPGPLLALLEEIGYVASDRKGLYRLTVPVLDDSDREMVEKLLATSRNVMRPWLESHAAGIRRELAGLTAIRAGLSFEEVFTQVWHEIFGATTRELVRDGVIASAYGREARSKGSFSVLWRPRLYAFIPG
ncbi:MAG TPA: hypothetical protein VFS34_06665 [Thermoanaerobaculia bacterium]|nr:hypothetical protein [Thermoanaerobaculia bacterium]